MRTKLKGLAVAASVLVLGQSNAKAISVGDSMSVNYRYPNLGTVIDSGQSFTVAPGGTTFTRDFSNLTLDISVVGDTITISRFQWGGEPLGTTLGFSPGAFNGLVFTDFSAAFSGFTLTSLTSLPGFDSSRIAINGNDLSLNFAGLNYTVGQSEVVLQAQTASVPEGGSTLVLLGVSLGLLFVGRLKLAKASLARVVGQVRSFEQ